MIVGVCTLDLYLPGSTSLKAKRSVLKPLLAQVRQRFEVAVAEVDYQDVWQSAQIAIAAISNDDGHLYALLEHAVHWIEENYRSVTVLRWDIELR